MSLHDQDRPATHGGEGGSVPVGKQVCVWNAGSAAYRVDSSTKHTHQYDDGTEGLDQAMIDAGVFCLNRAKRSKVAEVLNEQDVNGNDVAFLAAYIAQGEKDVGLQRKYLAALLLNPVEVNESLRCLKHHRRRMSATPYEGERNRMNYTPGPQEGEDPEQWQVERHAQIVYGRIHGDGATPECVAAETGWEVAQVQNLYLMGHKLYGGGM